MNQPNKNPQQSKNQVRFFDRNRLKLKNQNAMKPNKPTRLGFLKNLFFFATLILTATKSVLSYICFSLADHT